MANVYLLSWQEILDQLLSFLPPSWRANFTGKVLKRLLVAYALATEALYALLGRLLRLSIISTSEAEWLRALVAGFGMSAFAGTRAIATVRFTRYGATDDAVTIPLGTRCGAVFGQIYATDYVATLPAGETFVDVPATAIAPGTAGAVRSGEIISLLTPVPGVDDVSNPNPSFGGADPESDIEIKERVPRYLDSLHRGTIPATEYAIAVDRETFPEVRGFLTQRNYGNPGYFRGILSDANGGNSFRARNWNSVGNGVFFIPTSLPEVNGLVAAGWPCQRFGIVTRLSDGEEIWQASSFVNEVEQGTYRFCHDKNLGRIYAKADGRDLNTMQITIYAGVVWRALRVLEKEWAANGVFLDVLAPFVVQGAVSVSYSLEPGYTATVVETQLRNSISDYVQSLNLGQNFEIENLYAALALIPGAAGVLVDDPTVNVDVPPDSVFRLSAVPVVTRRST